jgi:molybdenum cofactor cytidylyltransferase
VSPPTHPPSPSFPAIVLAAGASSRMGQSKALLRIHPDRTFLGRILRTLSDASLDPLIVVTREQLDLAAAWGDPRATEVIQVINPDPSRGQLSSLICGLNALSDAPSAILVALVDVPLPKLESVRALIDAWLRTRAPLVRPVHRGLYGHPVIFGDALLTLLRDANPAEGAKPVVRAFTDRSVAVEVDDPGVLRDVDTPEEYQRLFEV